MLNTGDFVHAKELVDHLDYLEVDRTLVYHRGALDAAPLSRNMELIEECAKYSDRLFPALVIAPSDRYADGRMDWLKQQAEAGHRAFVMNQMPPFSFRQYEFLLEELHPYAPVIFTDPRHELYQTADGLEYLAKRFPDATFMIYCGLFSCILDLMERCPNINAVISQIQTRDAFELIRDKFGVHRLFYGFRFKSNYGASIGALMHSSLTPEEKELVAHGNLERLLKLPPLKTKQAKSNDWTEKPLWKCFKEGKKLENVSIYDAHSHEFTGPATPLRDNSSPDLLKKTVDRMDSLGISAMLMTSGGGLRGGSVLHSSNCFLEKIRQFPGRFFIYFPYNPHFANEITTEFLDSYFSNHECVGFKLLPQYWELPLDDPGYLPVWRYAEEHRLPILIHTWGDAAPLKTIAPAYPHAKFILGHSGGGRKGRKEAVEIGSIAPNTFFEFCATFCCSTPFEEVIRKFGSDRVLFGSDATIHNQAFELAGYLSMPLPDSELMPGLAENIMRILHDKQ